MNKISRAVALACLVSAFALGSVAFASGPPHKGHKAHKTSAPKKDKPNKAIAKRLKPMAGKG